MVIVWVIVCTTSCSFLRTCGRCGVSEFTCGTHRMFPEERQCGVCQKYVCFECEEDELTECECGFRACEGCLEEDWAIDNCGETGYQRRAHAIIQHAH